MDLDLDDISAALDDISSADTVMDDRQSFEQMNAELETLKAKVDRMDQRISSLEQQMIRQIETMSKLVSYLCTGIPPLKLPGGKEPYADSVLESSRKQAIEFNRHITKNNLAGGVEGPFRDGTLPSS